MFGAKRRARGAAASDFDHPRPSDRPLTFVMLRDPVDLADIEAALRAGLAGAPIERFEEGGPRLVVRVDGVEVTVATMPVPFPPACDAAAFDPVWWQGHRLPLDHRAHVMMVPTPTSDSPPDRAAATAILRSTSRVACALVRLPGAVGVYSGNALTGWPTEAYERLVTEAFDDGNAPVVGWASVVVGHDEGVTRGYTCGLAGAGHCEIQIEESRRPPAEIYTLLGDVAMYVLGGATLSPGQTVGFDDDDRLRLSASTWMGSDEREPALRIEV